MKVLVALVLIASLMHVAQSIPRNFEPAGSYGIYYGSRKSYFVSKTRLNWNDHVVECTNGGLTPLSLDTAMEQEYFLALFRNNPDFVHIAVGATKSGTEWVWKNTWERISYPMAWQNGPMSKSEDVGDCLSISKQGGPGIGFKRIMCSEVNNFFCQKIGN